MRNLVIIAILAAFSTQSVQAEERLAWKIVNLNLGESVNMRAAPTTSAPIVQKIAYNTGIVEIDGECVDKETYNWCPVKVDEKKGWIVDRYLQKVRLVTKTPDVPVVAGSATIPEAPAIKAKDDKGIFFIYHQMKPKKSPTGCMPVAASKLPPVDDLEAVKGAIGKKIAKTVCCEVEYVYFSSKSACKSYVKEKALPPAGEEEPITIPDEVNNL